MTKAKTLKQFVSVAVALAMASGIGATALSANAANLSAGGRYYSDYVSREEAEKAAEKLNKQLAGEGMILLKNDGTLPVKQGAKISLLGIAQDCLIETSGSVADSLKNAGFEINPTLEHFYATDSAKYHDFGNESQLTYAAKQSIELYNDVGIIVLGRGTSGESGDLSLATGEQDDETYLGDEQGWSHEAHLTDEAGNALKHQLQLTQSEEQLIQFAKQKCKKVVVLYSASYTFEMANLQEDDGINAIMWIGRQGDGAIDSIGEVLNGTINPSGKTVDEWTRDFTNDPTYVNAFSSAYTDKDGKSSGYAGIDYEEDIYLGYKYYETYWHEAAEGNASPEICGETATADEWYAHNVVYPFGYGLSYTNFSFELAGLYTDAACTTQLGATVKAEDLSSSAQSPAKIKTLYAKVDVTNTGAYTGKEVVQVYVTAPYTQYGTEKSYVTLVGYVKTPDIQATETASVVVAFNVQDFSSYDATNANKDEDGHTGYELDAGEYVVHVMNNSHVDANAETYASKTFNVEGTAYLDADDFSGNAVENLFSKENGDYYSLAVAEDAGSMKADGLLSRANFDATKPSAPTAEQLKLSDAAIQKIKEYEYIDAETIDDTKYPWYHETVPADWKQATGVVNPETGMYDIVLDDMAGKPLSDPQWTQFVNQFTWEEIASVVNNGYHLTVALPNAGKLETTDENGPNYTWNSNYWCGAPLIGATWNTELVETYGKMVANLALWQDMTGWYGPGTNIHRNQFSGRSPEYYSQDALQGGYIAAAAIKGATERGINVYVKHFVMYDVSDLGGSGIANASEQCMRENYFKIFQMAMQEGGATATMTAFNKIGYIYAGQNYNLIQRLARDEWGWTGFAVTDIYMQIPTMTIDGLVRAGANIPDGDFAELTYSYTNLAGEKISGSKALSGEWDASLNNGQGGVSVNGKVSNTQWYTARTAFMQVLYNEVNSAGNYNGVTDKELSETFQLKQGVKTSQSILPEKYLKESSGYEVSSNVLSGTLPKGLTIANGMLTGTPQTSGEYKIALEVVIDGWIKIALNLNLNVTSIIDMEEDISSIRAGDKVDVYVEFDATATEYQSSYTVSLSEGQLPTGLTIGSDGRIQGTATEVGEFTFTLAVKALDISRDAVDENMPAGIRDLFMNGFGLASEAELIAVLKQMGPPYSNYVVPANETYYHTYTISVTGEDIGVPEVKSVQDVTLDGNGDIVVTYTDGTTSKIELNVESGGRTVTGIALNEDKDIVVSYSDGTSSVIETQTVGKVVQNIVANEDGTITVTYSDNTTATITVKASGNESNSGCGASVGGSLSIVFAALLGLGSVLVVRSHKKRQSR